MNKHFFTFTVIVGLSIATAQSQIITPNYIKYPMDSVGGIQFDKNLNELFAGISKDNIDMELLEPRLAELTKSQLQELSSYETRKDSATALINDKQLVNLYPVATDQYWVSVAYIDSKSVETPIFYYLINLIATKIENQYKFSLPLHYLTSHWKNVTVGNLTYYFRDSFNSARATQFDQKNTEIAQKLGIQEEKLDFYLCENFQEISRLLGYEYSVYSNGKYRDGYGVDANTIFSIMNNEDFSHDIFHYYSGKINERKNRNWITEEGLAYAWGNAYYTDPDGEMIGHSRLIGALKTYLSQNPDTDLFQLFSDNTKVLSDIAAEVSVRSTLSGLIALEVERKKGKKGISTLINAGSKDRLERYLKATDELIGINEDNFNIKVKKLLSAYK